MYNPRIISETCIYKNKLVGLPFTSGYFLLYSNEILLNKYNKTIPKTWDELIKTSKYILEKENDPDLVGYNGVFDESENSICSLYEFIYSCRDSKDSPFPNIRSETTVNALNLLKKIKEEISSDDIFSSDINYSLSLLYSGKGLFIKFWIMPYTFIANIPYKLTVLPGIKEGISGSCLAGYNLGIDKYIPEEKLDASIVAFKYLTSKEIQKKYSLASNIISGITSLYDDKEICENINCETFKSIQPISRPSTKKYNNSDYNKKIMHYFNQFLYKNQTVYKVLEQIDDLTKIYNVSLNNDDTKLLTMILIILVIFSSSIMILSLLFLYNKKLKIYFQYMSNDLWIISIIGLILILNSSLTTLGPLTNFKCELYIILIAVGYTLNLAPILYKYIINFPEKNKISSWFMHHKYSFLAIFIVNDVMLSLLFSFKIYIVKEISIHEGKSYRICSLNGTYGLVVITLVFMLFFIFILIMFFFGYIDGIKKLLSLMYDLLILQFILTYYLCYFYFL